MSFQPKQFLIKGRTWAEFSDELANLLPSVLSEIANYLDEYPTAKPLIEWIRFDYSIDRIRLEWYVSGSKLNYMSGNFANAEIEIGKNYPSIFDLDFDDEESDEVAKQFEKFEKHLIIEITNAMAKLTNNKEIAQKFDEMGVIMILNDADCRVPSCEVFPKQTYPLPE